MSGDTPAIRYLSLGWGVQSFTISAICALGELVGLGRGKGGANIPLFQMQRDSAARGDPRGPGGRYNRIGRERRNQE